MSEDRLRITILNVSIWDGQIDKGFELKLSIFDHLMKLALFLTQMTKM